jgi:hypothetical protein
MFEIKFYKDKNGHEPVKEYLAELAAHNDNLKLTKPNAI